MPGFLTTPDDPENPDAQALPTNPTYPSYPVYPNYPGYPAYPGYPTYPITSSSYVQGSPDGSIAITTTHRVSPASSASLSSAASSLLPAIAPGSPMILGIDSLIPSSTALLANARSNSYLGQGPQFWGRYFYAPGQINSLGKRDSHYSSAENAMLRANNIRVLPLARQTNHVGNPGKAVNDAAQNVAAIFEVFPPQYLSGADPDILVFLDVEKDSPMVAEYYETWSNTLVSEATQKSSGRVRFHPAIYGSQGDDVTWSALKQAISNGAPCDGIWIARYYYGTPVPKPWDDRITTPSIALHPPIVSWQYWASPDDAPEAKNLDTNLASPAHADALMNGLVMPPS